MSSWKTRNRPVESRAATILSAFRKGRVLLGAGLGALLVLLLAGAQAGELRDPLAPMPGASSEESAQEVQSLRKASDFASMKDKKSRAVALFEEAAKVLTHPRCINCHPSGDQPLQGEASAIHQPPVQRGRGGLGSVGMRCSTCHFSENYDPGRVPGAPRWHLAPKRMAWEGLSLGELCEQLKDPARNGGRTLREVVEHMRDDPLVAWGWEPGTGREPVPGTQKAFGDLVAAWVKAGASCPEG